MIYCTLKNKEMPWGSYGRILLTGMTCHRGPLFGRYQLERTGPFVPPIIDSGIGNYTLNNYLFSKISTVHPDVKLIKVIKRKIRKVDWMAWDLSANKPEIRPSGGEPENYILSGFHDLLLSIKMGPIFQFGGGSKCEFIDDNIFSLVDKPGKVINVETDIGKYELIRKDFAEWLVENGQGWVSLGKEYSIIKK